MSARFRRALTLVEVLVVIFIIGLLFSLLVPAVTGPIGESRGNQCASNLSQLAKAAQIYATTSQRAFPGWVQYQRLANDPNRQLVLPWPGELLAQLDEQGLHDQLLAGEIDPSQPPRLEILICPSDVGLDEEQGRLTYVANSGIPDVVDASGGNGSVLIGDLKANGVCHDLRVERDGQQGRPVNLRDGANTTLLFSENIDKDLDTTWLGPFKTPIDPTVREMDRNPEQRLGMVWLPGVAAPGPPPVTDFQPLNRDTRTPPSDSYSDGQGYQFARPASEHPEIFNVAFCGGNTRAINEAIEYRVYQQLMTSDGKYADNPASPGDVDYRQYMVPALADGEY